MKKSAAIWILILVMLIWGSSYAVTKSTLQEVPPSMLAFIRFLIASAAMLPFYLQSSHKTSRPSAKDYYLMGWMGFSGITGYFLLFNYALLYTSASSGALIQGSMPLCIALLGALLLKEKLRKLQITGIICSFAGVVLVAWTGGDQSGEKNMLLGNMLMFASVLCWTAYTLLSRKIKHLNPLKITFLSTCAGTALLFPFALAEYLQAGQVSFSAEHWVAMGYLAIFSSALGNLLYNKTLENLQAATVGNFLNLDILTGVLIAVIFLHEQISLKQIIGGTLILSGLFLSAKTQKS